MKQTRKLIALILFALALNPAGKNVEAKNLPTKQSGIIDQQTISEVKQDLYTVKTISFSGLESLSEQELTASLPLKTMDRIAIPGMELSGALQYLWKLQLFSDITVERNDLGQSKSSALFSFSFLV